MTDDLLPTTEQSAPKTSRKAWVVFAFIVILLVAMVSVWLITIKSDDDKLSAVAKSCDVYGERLSVADKGKTLILDSIGGTANLGSDVNTLTCVLANVEAPRAVVSQITSTRAVDGRQRASWGDYEASWTYLPASGLDLIIQEK